MQKNNTAAINNYLNQIRKEYKNNNYTEITHRSALQQFLESLTKGLIITNEPRRQKCGAPDFIIQRKELPIGYIETKKIAINLDKKEKSEQMVRYLKSLSNLILTDYLEFRFFKFGEKHEADVIKLASIENRKILAHSENFDSFIKRFSDFCSFNNPIIESVGKLTSIMANKARMIEEVIYKAVKEDEEDNTLKGQLQAFKQILMNNLDEKTFADIYAQTITYGLFAARLHDNTQEPFTRQKARDLIPKTNPFLRNLFDYISGAQLDSHIEWILNDLTDIFRVTDLDSLLVDFGKSTEL